MKNFINMVSTIIFVCYLSMSNLGMINMSTVEAKETNISLLAQQKCYEQQINTYDNLLEKWSVEKLIWHKLNNNKRITYKPSVKRNDMNNQFLLALADYKGPTILITSMKRDYNPRSEHYHGRAIDMRIDYKVVLYLCSKQGKEWIRNNRLRFYIETSPAKQRALAPYLKQKWSRKYCLVNKHASAIHIHLEAL